MNAAEICILNFEEVRRRSIMVWKGLPEEFNNWRPDENAESFIEVIRHVLSCEYLFHKRILQRGALTGFISPWEGRPLINLTDELRFAEPYRKEFLSMVRNFSENDLDSIEVGIAQKRKLGDYLLRVAYHESVHNGQFLSNLRRLGVSRPYIWD
jgi:uncharacterized damage-inducible protein DinB